MSQFAFLAAEFPAVHEHASRAENLAHADPRAACFYARFALEVMVQWLYRHDSSLRDPYDTTLAARIHEPTFQKLVGPPLVAKARIVKDLGNAAVHETKAVAPAKAITALRELFHLSYWLARTYGRTAQPDAKLAFSPDALPRTSSIAVAKLAQLQEIARRFAETVKAREDAEQQRLASEAEREKLDAEIKALQAQVAAAKAANARRRTRTITMKRPRATPSSTSCSRKSAGRSSSRAMTRNSRSRACPTRRARALSTMSSGATTASRSASSKRSAPGATRVSASSKQSSMPIAWKAEFGQRPIIFYSNGYEHWLWDDTRYPPRAVSGFPEQGRAGACDPPPRDAEASWGRSTSIPRSSSASTRPAPSAASPKPSRRTI